MTRHASRPILGLGLAVLAGCGAPRPVLSKTSPVDSCHMVNVGSGLRYDCAGFTAAFHDDPPNAPENPQRTLDEMVTGLVTGFRQLVEKFDAKIRVEKSAQEIAGKSVLAAKVTVDHPSTSGTYAAGYAVVAGRRGIICTAESGAEMERCAPVIRFLVEDRSP